MLCPLPRWLLNLFHNQIESKLQKVLENKVRKASGTSRLLHRPLSLDKLSGSIDTHRITAQRGKLPA
jgi:hypothetical protein